MYEPYRAAISTNRFAVLIGVQDSTDWQVAFSFSH